MDGFLINYLLSHVVDKDTCFMYDNSFYLYSILNWAIILSF